MLSQQNSAKIEINKPSQKKNNQTTSPKIESKEHINIFIQAECKEQAKKASLRRVRLKQYTAFHSDQNKTKLQRH